MSTRKVNPLIGAINNSIRESRTSAHRALDWAKALESKRMMIRAKYSGAFKDFDMDRHYLSMYTWADKPMISVSLYSLEGFKDQQLVNMVEFFMGFEHTVRTEEDAAQFARTYEFTLDDVIVLIHARIRSDSETCERVQVGTEIKEVPVYELRCS